MTDQQVCEAALAVIRPTTDASTRSAASTFLEQWNTTSEAWSVYVNWLQSFAAAGSSSDNNSCASAESVGMQLLCLTLLLQKIRRELIKGHAVLPEVAAIRDQLWNLISQMPQQQEQQQHQLQPLISPLCSCLSALVVRCYSVGELVSTCCQPNSPSPVLPLRLLASLPPELEAYGELTTPQVTAELTSHLSSVLSLIQQALTSTGGGGATAPAAALDCLAKWAHASRLTLTQLLGTRLLNHLVDILSQPTPPAQEEVYILCAESLTEAILIPSDTMTETRQQAVLSLMESISQRGFISTPLQYCLTQDWDRASHALATCLSTLVSEEVDLLCARPADSYMGLLLQIQSHPNPKVALTMLECWLTVQDIPLSDRHEHWKAPLFAQVLQTLVQRCSYSADFTNWQDELEWDETEFNEFRRMSTDVLVNCYLLLRVDCLKQLLQIITTSTGPQLMESALFCLTAASREVCARVKSKGSSSADRTETAQQLLQLAHFICTNTQSLSAGTISGGGDGIPVLQTACKFMGAYAPAWNVHCDYDDILQLLEFLQRAMSISNAVLEGAKATKAIYINCSTKLLANPNIVKILLDSFQASLASGNGAAMAAVAEGCTRLVVQKRQHLNETYGGLFVPLQQQTNKALAAVTGIGGTTNSIKDAHERELAKGALIKYLQVMQVMIRFCETPQGQPSPLETVVDMVWPLLQQSVNCCCHDGDEGENGILKEVLAIQKQLISNVPDLIAPRFPETVKFVVGAYEKTKHPGTLDYLSAAVEVFSPDGGEEEKSFCEILGHVTRVTTTFVTSEMQPDACPQVIRAFFELCQRYIIFCPSALMRCGELKTIVRLAVECLVACKGERQSTRACLNFLAQFFGWRSLRLTPTATRALELHAHDIDELLKVYGESMTRFSISGLAGGAPQMVWPALSDCVIAVVTHVLGSNASAPVVEDHTIAHQWVYQSLTACQTYTGKPLAPEICEQVVRILFQFALHHAKPKAKLLLTDFARVCKGEMSTETLLSYGLDENALHHQA